MIEMTDFNFAEDDFTAADLAKFELIKSVEVEDLNNLAELLNQIVAAKVAKLSLEKKEFYDKKLALKELELDTFYNHSPCGYFSTAQNGIITKINDTLLGWLGYAKEDIIDQVTWQSMLSVGGKMYFETHYSPLLQMQSFVQEISFEMVKKDNTRLPILINTKQIRDENGNVQVNYSTVFDVSQRKSYEKELLIAKRTAEDQNKLIHETNEMLLASEEELKTTIEEIERLNENLNELVEYTFKNASIPIYFVLEDASIYNFNDIAAENLGYTSEELQTLKSYDLYKDYDEKKWASGWAKLKEKKKITIETQQKKKDGTLIDVIITANYLKYCDLELSCSFVLDITEKKKLEKELKLIDFTFNNSAIPIFLVKEDSSIYNINEAAAKNLGYSQEELMGKKIIELDHNFDKEKWALHWANIKANGNITIETTPTKKDGTIVDFIININYLKQGDLELICSYAIDITEKKKVERQLNLLDYSYKHTDSAMFFLDVEGSFIDYNQATANLLGYSFEEFRDKTALDVNPMLTKESWVKRWEELKGTPYQNFDVKLKRKDGTFIDVAVTTNIIELNDKIVNFGFYRDITEKKKLEDNLKLSAFTIDNAAWGLAYIKPDGTLYNCNLAFAKMYGNTSVAEMMTKTAFDFGSAHTTETWKQYWDELKQKKNLHYIVKRTKKDGTIIDVEINANMIQFGDLELNCVYVNDITEKKKAEERLKLSDYIIQKATAGIFLLKSDGSIYDFNEAACAMLGYTKEEFGMLNKMDIDPRLNLGIILEGFEVIRREGNVSFQATIVKKDGALIDVEITSTFIVYDGLELKCSFITEITDKKKAEAEIYSINELLQRQTNRLLLATKSAKLGIWDRDLENDSIFWDEGMYELYRITPNEFKTNNEAWIARLHEEDRAKILAEMQLNLSKNNEFNSEFNSEFRIVWSDSSIHYIRTTGFIERVDGKPKRIIGVSWDVTAEKEKVMHLKLLESVIVHTKDSIVITEAEPFDEPGPRIIFVNPAFEKMTGYTSDEVIGLTPRLLQNNDTDRKELDKLRIAFNKWEPCEVTVSNSKKNGEKFWLNMQITPIVNEKGDFTHFIAVERDVTKQKEAEEEKENLLKELVANNLDLRHFTYITSHNLRAPLTNLVSICDIIQPETVTDAFTKELINGFKTSTYHLNETLNDLIEVLIIKENRSKHKDQLTFEEIFKKITESLSISLQEQRVIINADFADAPSVFFANEYLESIFLNLLTNSVKYRHPNRQPIITIKTSIEANGDTKLSFTDNGIGINMAFAKDKIFGLYKRFHNNADSKGIGLYLIHSQITTLGGKIEVESEVNIGTTFTITFK